MLSLVDLKDFAEICRAIEEYTLSGKRLNGAVGPHHRTRGWTWGGEELAIADSSTPSRRFYRDSSALD